MNSYKKDSLSSVISLSNESIFPQKARTLSRTFSIDKYNPFRTQSLDSCTSTAITAPKISQTRVNYSVIRASMPEILSKFDALFPIYRLSDKDCKRLCYIVYDELNLIDSIFCDSIGRYLEVKIYYYGSKMARKFFFYNSQDSTSEVSNWNNILMDEEYCFKQLGYHIIHLNNNDNSNNVTKNTRQRSKSRNFGHFIHNNKNGTINHNNKNNNNNKSHLIVPQSNDVRLKRMSF